MSLYSTLTNAMPKTNKKNNMSLITLSVYSYINSRDKYSSSIIDTK